MNEFLYHPSMTEQNCLNLWNLKSKQLTPNCSTYTSAAHLNLIVGVCFPSSRMFYSTLNVYFHCLLWFSSVTIPKWILVLRTYLREKEKRGGERKEISKVFQQYSSLLLQHYVWPTVLKVKYKKQRIMTPLAHLTVTEETASKHNWELEIY